MQEIKGNVRIHEVSSRHTPELCKVCGESTLPFHELTEGFSRPLFTPRLAFNDNGDDIQVCSSCHFLIGRKCEDGFCRISLSQAQQDYRTLLRLQADMLKLAVPVQTRCLLSEIARESNMPVQSVEDIIHRVLFDVFSRPTVRENLASCQVCLQY